MKIIKDLLEVYTHFINLPMTFVNLNEEIEYIQDFHLIMKRIPTVKKHVKEVQKFIEFIKTPTLIEVEDDVYKHNPHYIVTPIFIINSAPHYILIGPFSIEPYIHTNEPFEYFSDEDLEEVLLKVNKFYQFMRNKEKIENGSTSSDQYLMILEEILLIENQKHSLNDYLNLVLMHLLRFKEVDFIGIALCNPTGVYEVKHFKNKLDITLRNPSFYLDRCILGDAVILNRTIQWDETKDTHKLEFFIENKIEINNLLALPIENVNLNNGILFIGNTSSLKFNNPLQEFLKIVMQSLSRMFILETAKNNETRTNELFSILNELAIAVPNSLTQMKLENIMFKLLRKTSNEPQIIFTTVTGSIMKTSNFSEQFIENHYKKLVKQTRNLNAYDGEYIHGFIEEIGNYSIKVEDSIQANKTIPILNVIQQLIESIIMPKFDHDFFEKQYGSLSMEDQKIVSMIIQRVKAYRKKYIFDEKIVSNLVKVMFNQKELNLNKLAYTNENEIFKEMDAIYKDASAIKKCSLEGRLFAYINNKYYLDHLYDLDELQMIFADFEEENIIGKSFDPIEVIKDLDITSREKDVLKLIVQGLNNIEVAGELNISSHTVKNHITNILKKFNVTDRVQLIAKLLNGQL